MRFIQTYTLLSCWFLFSSLFAFAGENTRPNIVWLTCEDISPYLGCYGFKQAQTPHLDGLAAGGVRYNHAYANAPVCAVARSTLLTGMYSSTIGTHQMRSHVQLPPDIPAYPKLLRETGYYCTNNSKKDYNSNFEHDPTLWDESSRTAHYKNRRDGQPFFAVFNILVTHESQLNAKRIAEYVGDQRIPVTPRVVPSKIELPPYHPDLPEIRADWARFHDLITLMDKLVGDRLQELQEHGLADDTIVFFFSDHGGNLSRAKRYIYNTGTQVPLIIRFPSKWQHITSDKPGSSSNRLVSFVDLPKTVLSLAGLPVPRIMQGRTFLGANSEPAPQSVHFYRDRMTERYDFSRAVTDGRYYLVRNFMPHRPLGRDITYGFEMQANWTAWERHFENGKCDATQSRFFLPKAAVELFDTRHDPWHIADLSEHPTHQDPLLRLTADLDKWMIETRDVGFIPEPLFHEFVGPEQPWKTLYEYAQSSEYPIRKLVAIAKQVSSGEVKKLPDYLGWMRHQHPIIRYWGAYGVFLVRLADAHVQDALRVMIAGDTIAGNRLMAAQALGRCGDPDTSFATILKETLATEEGYIFLQGLNAFQYSHTDNRLTRQHWESFKNKKPTAGRSGADASGFAFAQLLIQDAVNLWPERRAVD